MTSGIWKSAVPRLGDVVLPDKDKNSREWKDCLAYIAKRVKAQSFTTWLKPTMGWPGEDGRFVLVVPNAFVADWIKSYYGELIEEAFDEVLGASRELVFEVRADAADQSQTAFEFGPNETAGEVPWKVQAPGGNGNNGNGHHGDNGRTSLNDKYRFNNMVVGDFNEFVCAAAMAVADGPGTARYNPLFIYGGVGLGKTHMVQAIGNEILDLYAGKQVLYATSEKFTSDFINAISSRRIEEFTSSYRNVDVLIIDDVQFLTGKESTQEQFFHTFNTLYQAGKQIVLTSDRPPKEIKGLEERLLSRFFWGLLADLQAPDLENRIAIIYKKLEADRTSLPEEVVRFIADQVTTNIRELEGALNCLLARASLHHKKIDLDTAKRWILESHKSGNREISITLIQRKVADEFDVEPAMMTAKKKTAPVALARQVAMYLACLHTNKSLQAIGNEFGGRDHSTVIHARELIERRRAEDPILREKIDKLTAALVY